MLNSSSRLHILGVAKLKIQIFNAFATITKTVGVLMIVLCLLCVVGVREGVAQGAGGEDPMKDTYSGASVYDKKVPNLFGKTTTLSGIIVQGITQGNTDSTSEDTKENAPIESDKEPIKIRSLERKQDFHMFVPKNAFKYMVDSKEWEKMYDEAVSGGSNSSGSTSMIGAVTWGLANSAVGQARYNAIMQTQSALLNHYMAELTFLKQVDMNPYMKEHISDAYFACVRKKMKPGEGGGRGNGSSRTTKLSWFEAQEVCMGDDSELNDNNDKLATDKMFTFADSYDFDQKNSNGEDGKKICLTDYLFYQEKEANNGSNSDIKNLQNEYRQFIGDIAFNVDTEGDDQEGKGVRKMKYQVIYPGDTEAKYCKPSENRKEEQEPRKFFKKILIHRFKTLVKALYGYCQAVTGETGEAGGSNGQASNKSYWEEKQKEFLAYYSNPDFQMNEFLAQSLFDVYEYYEKKKDGQKKIDCSPLETLTNVEEGDLDDFGSGTEDKNKVTPYKIIYYYLALNISKADVFLFYANYYNWINALSSTTTGKSNFLAEIAHSQINAVLFRTFGNVEKKYTDAISALNLISTNVSNWQNTNQSSFFGVLEGNDGVFDNTLDGMTGQ